MPAGESRQLRRRIRSIESTRKTTKAMELIAGSRINRAQARVAQARPYLERLGRLVADVAAAPGGEEHRLLAAIPAGSAITVVVIVGDRGLSGAYNSTVLRRADDVLAAHRAAGNEPRLVVVGKKGVSFFRYRRLPVERHFLGITDRPTHEDAERLAEAVVAPFLQGAAAAIEVVSTRFVSAGVQRVEHRRLVPLPADARREGRAFDYEMEPDRDELLDALVPRVVLAGLFVALLEASASEHAARQRAMKAATDNADELITKLGRVMNRARQEEITGEILDIVGGSEALRQLAAAGAGEAPVHLVLGGGR